MKRLLLLLLIVFPQTGNAQKMGFRPIITAMNQTVSEFNYYLEKKDFLPLIESESMQNPKNVWTGKTLFGKHKITIQVKSNKDNDEIPGEILLDFNDNLAGKLMYSRLERKINRRCDYFGSRKMSFLYRDDMYYQAHIHSKSDIEFRLFIFEGHNMIKIVHYYKGEDF